MKKYIALGLVVSALISGCASNEPAAGSASQRAPAIIASSSKDGKGIPNGRSDSDAAYFRKSLLGRSQDPEYGKKPENPIKTAPRHANGHIWFLNSLRGPEGQPIEYERRGSCCAFKDESLEFGGGLLDVYEIKVDGGGDTILLYVDMYHQGPPEIPVGFTQRKVE